MDGWGSERRLYKIRPLAVATTTFRRMHSTEWYRLAHLHIPSSQKRFSSADKKRRDYGELLLFFFIITATNQHCNCIMHLCIEIIIIIIFIMAHYWINRRYAARWSPFRFDRHLSSSHLNFKDSVFCFVIDEDVASLAIGDKEQKIIIDTQTTDCLSMARRWWYRLLAAEGQKSRTRARYMSPQYRPYKVGPTTCAGYWLLLSDAPPCFIVSTDDFKILFPVCCTLLLLLLSYTSSCSVKATAMDFGFDYHWPMAIAVKYCDKWCTV